MTQRALPLTPSRVYAIARRFQVPIREPFASQFENTYPQDDAPVHGSIERQLTAWLTEALDVVIAEYETLPLSEAFALIAILSLAESYGKPLPPYLTSIIGVSVQAAFTVYQETDRSTGFAALERALIYAAAQLRRP